MCVCSIQGKPAPKAGFAVTLWRPEAEAALGPLPTSLSWGGQCRCSRLTGNFPQCCTFPGYTGSSHGWDRTQDVAFHTLVFGGVDSPSRVRCSGDKGFEPVKRQVSQAGLRAQSMCFPSCQLQSQAPERPVVILGNRMARDTDPIHQRASGFQTLCHLGRAKDGAEGNLRQNITYRAQVLGQIKLTRLD